MDSFLTLFVFIQNMQSTATYFYITLKVFCLCKSGPIRNSHSQN